ncbi:polysaccharide biosynthesis/export family protein [Rhizobium sp. S152]|uniref:polysaccharide biosynthesis/export family protein n=1 Tax=Rhizobium sp. S152 TaxID=3055038 RepID=UPI0025AA2ED1|nr:polysaccharide biosynthesis/export family protein [Rhizobium sp. S152]MDM9624868.1 polysaccharide biosynthesis/export family protein [Rhizobium sp. S152]
MRFASVIACLLFVFSMDRAYGQEKYLLQPGDSLEIWVAQEEDLRRTVVVEPDGWVSFPLAGHMQAAGSTVTEIEAAFSEKLRPFFKEKPNLTIMLRPDPLHRPSVFVAGEVTTPGSFPYRQGMTVLHAISVAGGIYRKEVLAADQDRSIIVRRTVEASQARLKQLAARHARLQAQLDGSSTIDIAAEDRDDDVVTQEQSMLDAYQSGIGAQDTARVEAVNLGKQNAGEIKRQMEIVDRRLELAKQRSEATTALVEKGALQAGQKFDRDGEVATLEGARSQLQTQLLAAQRTLQADLALIDNAAQSRKEKLLADIVDVERDQKATRESLADAEDVLKVYESSSAAGKRVSQKKISYRIVRSANGEPREFEASEMTPIRPGDLVRVVVDAPPLAVEGAELTLQSDPDQQSAPADGTQLNVQ